MHVFSFLSLDRLYMNFSASHSNSHRERVRDSNGSEKESKKQQREERERQWGDFRVRAVQGPEDQREHGENAEVGHSRSLS